MTITNDHLIKITKNEYTNKLANLCPISISCLKCFCFFISSDLNHLMFQFYSPYFVQNNLTNQVLPSQASVRVYSMND